MEIKKIEKSDLVLFPRLQEQGVEPRPSGLSCGM
jgi:hypothetical protein